MCTIATLHSNYTIIQHASRKFENRINLVAMQNLELTDFREGLSPLQEIQLPHHGYQVVWHRNETSVLAPRAVSHTARLTSVFSLNGDHYSNC